MNKAEQLLAGLTILKEFEMGDLQFIPLNQTGAFNSNYEKCTFAVLSIEIPYKQTFNIEKDTQTLKTLKELGWSSEQDYQYWIFRD